MTALYRAASRSTARARACFSPELATAIAYQDNPGFGGPNLYVFEVEDHYRLNLLRSQSPLLDLAETLEYDAPRETVRAWRDRGADWVFSVVEDIREVRERLQEHYDWISYVDQFPRGARTWMYLGDNELRGEQVDADGSLLVKESHATRRKRLDREIAVVRPVRSRRR